MSIIEENIAQAKKRVKKLEEQKKFEIRKMRKEKKKREQHRNYVVGEMFIEHFNELSLLEPGTKVENAVTFQPLNEFLEELSADVKWRNLLKEKLSKSTVYTERITSQEMEMK